MEAYDILRDQEENLPIGQLGDGLRALGLNPTEVQVMVRGSITTGSGPDTVTFAQ